MAAEESSRRPRVSIAMLAYNHEAFISDALASVLAQDMRDEIEIVVGEDCSQDRTREIIETISKDNPGIVRLITHPENVGSLRNFERVISECDGEYVAFLDGDDYWTDSRKLSRQVALLDQDPTLSMCFTGANIVDSRGRVTSVFPPPPGEKARYKFKDILRTNFVPAVTPLFRRAAFRGFPAWKQDFPSLPGDWLIYLDVAGRGDIGYVDEIMAARREHDGGEWTSMSDTQKHRHMMQMYDLLDQQYKGRYRGLIERAKSRILLEHAWLLGRSGEINAGRKALKSSLARAPAAAFFWPHLFFGSLLRLYVQGRAKAEAV